MSVVVGLVHEGRVWLGADSAASDDNTVVAYDTSKIVRRGKLLIGAIESLRMRDLLTHAVKFPRFKKEQTIEEYMFLVVEQIRRTFKENDFDLQQLVDEDEPSTPSGTILIAFSGRLFTIDWDFSLSEAIEPFVAIGAGAEFALGSLAVTQEFTHKFSPRLRVMNAMRVAAHYCKNVRAPFRILSSS